MFKKWYMKSEMKKIVRDCMSKYEGGESYFNELDSLVKSNTKLMIDYIKYITKKKNVMMLFYQAKLEMYIKKYTIKWNKFKSIHIVSEFMCCLVV